MRSAASGQQTERGTSLPADVPRSVAAQHQEALSGALTKLSATAQKAISAVDVADNPAIAIDVPAALAAVADQAAAVQRMLAELAAAHNDSAATRGTWTYLVAFVAPRGPGSATTTRPRPIDSQAEVEDVQAWIRHGGYTGALLTTFVLLNHDPGAVWEDRGTTASGRPVANQA
jgi:hypothetical protein